MYLFFLKVLIGQSFSAPLSNLIDLIPNDLDLFLCCRMSCVMLCCLCLQTNKIFLMLWMLLKLLTSLACIPCASGTGKKLYFRTLHISCLKLPWHSEICWSLYWTCFVSIKYIVYLKCFCFNYHFYRMWRYMNIIKSFHWEHQCCINSHHLRYCDWVESLSPFCSAVLYLVLK